MVYFHLNTYFVIGNQGGSTENITELDLETEGILVKPKLAPSQRFSRRVAIGELEKYVKEGLTSGELQRQHAVSIVQHCNGMEMQRSEGMTEISVLPLSLLR
jgi:hypothetical protein